MKRRKRYRVGIRKEYFPKRLRSEVSDSYRETVKVLAYDRTEAAEIAWKENGERWMKEISILRYKSRVSLEVDNPGVLGSIGRLYAIDVYTHQTEE